MLFSLFCLASFHAVAGGPESDPGSVTYSLVGIARFDGIAYASLFDAKTNNHIILFTGKSEHGLTLTSVTTEDDPVGPSATIKKDGASILLRLESDVVELSPGSQLTTIGQVPSLSLPGTNGSNVPKPPPGASLPLVFQDVDPKKINLSDDEKAAINQVRQDFLAAANGKNSGSAASSATSPDATNQNETSSTPNTTTTAGHQLKSWQTAQYLADEQLRMLLGWQGFSAYQLALLNQSAQ